MAYSLLEAATAARVNRSTVLRAIKSGKISATKDKHGEWRIDPAELHRVYPLPAQRPDQANDYATADALVAELRAQLADMRTQRDAWQQQAERLTLPKAPESWWRWLSKPLAS